MFLDSLLIKLTLQNGNNDTVILLHFSVYSTQKRRKKLSHLNLDFYEGAHRKEKEC